MDFRYGIEVFAAFIGIFAIALSSVMVFHKRDTQNVRYFSASIFLSGLWMLAVYFSDIATNLPGLIWWTKAASIFALGYVLFFVFFAYTFRYKRLSLKTALLIVTPIVINILYLYFFNPAKVYVSDPFIGFSYDQPVGGVLSYTFSIFLILFFIYYLLGFGILRWRRSMLSARERLQVRYISIGISSSIIAAVLFDIVLPIYGIDYLYAFGPACTCLLILAIGYAIIRHNLLDIRVFVQRGLVYSMLLGLSVAFYVGALSLTVLFFHALTHAEIILVAGITALVGIATVPRLQRFFETVTNPWFFKGRYDHATELHALSGIMNTTLEFDTLRAALSEKLISVFHNHGVAFLISASLLPSAEVAVPDEMFTLMKDAGPIIICEHLAGETLKNYFISHGYELAIAIQTTDEFYGFLALTKKRSDDPYTPADIQMLMTFSNQLSVAIKKSLLYMQLKDYADHLEERVRERTAEVQQLHAKQVQMIEDLSHELQTPLTVLKGELGMVREEHAAYNVHSNFERSIDEASRHLYGLMKLARMEMDASDAEHTAVNFSELLEEIIEYLQVLCAEQHIVVHADIQPGIILRGDRNALNDLITNLMSNAIKYIANERQIYVKLAVGEHVMLQIIDTGIGIHADDVPFIFKRFYKTKKSSEKSASIPSTGLGLAITRQIVKKHGGSISVESEVGVGSSFTVTFPKNVLL